MCVYMCVFSLVAIISGRLSLPVQVKHWLPSHPLRPANLLTLIDLSLFILFFKDISSAFFLFFIKNVLLNYR